MADEPNGRGHNPQMFDAKYLGNRSISESIISLLYSSGVFEIWRYRALPTISSVYRQHRCTAASTLRVYMYLRSERSVDLSVTVL